MILQKMKDVAEGFLGKTVKHAVVTVHDRRMGCCLGSGIGCRQLTKAADPKGFGVCCPAMVEAACSARCTALTTYWLCAIQQLLLWQEKHLPATQASFKPSSLPHTSC